MIIKKPTQILIAGGVILGLALFSACNKSVSSGARFSEADVALQQAVEDRLEANSRFLGVSYGVRVEVKDGTVTLMGEVDTLKDASLAEQIASATPGVLKVVNKIDLRSVRGKPGAKGFDTEMVRRQAEANGETIGNSPQDLAVYSSIRQQLIETSVTPKEAIFVDVVNQMVTFRGMVFSEQARKRAVAIASAMPEVKGVRDQLLVNTLEL